MEEFMKKLYFLLALCLLLIIFTSCSNRNQPNKNNLSSIEYSGTESISYDEKKIINYFLIPMHQGMIATSEYSVNAINEDILVRFYYLNNKSSFNTDENYLVDLEKCNLYLSNWFSVLEFDLKKSIYYDEAKNVLDLSPCIDLDGSKTEIILEKYTQTQEKLEIEYTLNFLIGDDLPPAKKSLIFLYNGEKYIFEQVKQQ